MGSWCWEGPTTSQAAPQGTWEPSEQGTAVQHAPDKLRCGGGSPLLPPAMAERLPPTPSPTSRPRPGLPPKQAPAAQPGGRVQEPAAPAWAWRQPRPGGTEPRHRDLGVWTRSRDLPEMTLGMPSPGVVGSVSLGCAGNRHLSCPTGSLPARHSPLHHAGRVPEPSLQPHSIRRHSPPQRQAGTRWPQPSCCVRAGDPVAGHSGKGQDADGTMQLPAQVARGGRMRGCLRPRLPSTGEWDDGLRGPSRAAPAEGTRRAWQGPDRAPTAAPSLVEGSRARLHPGSCPGSQHHAPGKQTPRF